MQLWSSGSHISGQWVLSLTYHVTMSLPLLSLHQLTPPPSLSLHQPFDQQLLPEQAELTFHLHVHVFMSILFSAHSVPFLCPHHNGPDSIAVFLFGWSKQIQNKSSANRRQETNLILRRGALLTMHCNGMQWHCNGK